MTVAVTRYAGTVAPIGKRGLVWTWAWWDENTRGRSFRIGPLLIIVDRSK